MTNAIEGLLESIINILNNIFSGLFNVAIDFVVFVVNLIFIPIDGLLASLMPNYYDILVNVYNFLLYALNYVGWLIDSLGIEHFTLVFLIDCLIFKLTVPISIYFTN